MPAFAPNAACFLQADSSGNYRTKREPTAVPYDLIGFNAASQLDRLNLANLILNNADVINALSTVISTSPTIQDGLNNYLLNDPDAWDALAYLIQNNAVVKAALIALFNDTTYLQALYDKTPVQGCWLVENPKVKSYRLIQNNTVRMRLDSITFFTGSGSYVGSVSLSEASILAVGQDFLFTITSETDAADISVTAKFTRLST